MVGLGFFYQNNMNVNIKGPLEVYLFPLPVIKDHPSPRPPNTGPAASLTLAPHPGLVPALRADRCSSTGLQPKRLRGAEMRRFP